MVRVRYATDLHILQHYIMQALEPLIQVILQMLQLLTPEKLSAFQIQQLKFPTL